MNKRICMDQLDRGSGSNKDFVGDSKGTPGGKNECRPNSFSTCEKAPSNGLMKPGGRHIRAGHKLIQATVHASLYISQKRRNFSHLA